ncbi:MAG TPA: hypothetical protein VE732_05230 [Nitrososphaera sp.]|jgi:hypothetical protein|nr:hypothetical protein [Nitrososphaera sp.]
MSASALDLINGTEFFDMASNREMLVKNWSDGHPWLFYKHTDGQWVSMRAATDEDMELLHMAYQEAQARAARPIQAFQPQDDL